MRPTHFALSLLLLSSTPAFSAETVLDTLVTCDEDRDHPQARGAVYEDEAGETRGIVVKLGGIRGDTWYVAYDEPVTLINDFSGTGRNGIYTSKDGAFTMQLDSKPGARFSCMTTLRTIGSSFVTAIYGSAEFESEIRYDSID